MQKAIKRMVNLVAILILVSFCKTINAAEDTTSSNEFELPVKGATGFASAYMNLLDSPNGKVITTLEPGTAFFIESEEEDYFEVKINDNSGWVIKNYVLINLPDIIPSIIYFDTNSISSIFTSSKFKLDGIYGKKLYNCLFYNNRFEEEQFVMPVLYPMAKKIQAAQSLALSNGDSLKIYETYRPFDVQMQVSSALSSLMESNNNVNEKINEYPWNKSWFIATKLSNHQRGIAIDVSLVKVISMEQRFTGNYSYNKITSYTSYKMPTKMHELSPLASAFSIPVSSKDKDAWRNAPLSQGMLESQGAQKLQNYCTLSGLTPLASEWWHFNDLDCVSNSSGDYYISSCLSIAP